MSMNAYHPSRLYIAAIAAAWVVVGCDTVPSSSDYDPTAKFSSYSTFALMERERGQREDDPVILQTEEAIKSRLQSKGYDLVSNPDRADFVLDFTLGSADRTDITSYPQPYAGRWFWDPGLRGGPYWGKNLDPRVYRDGTLSIDVFDQTTHRPVWHGWSKHQLSKSENTASEASIDQTVIEVLSWFPPGHLQ
jgi:hypothetical protein